MIGFKQSLPPYTFWRFLFPVTSGYIDYNLIIIILTSFRYYTSFFLPKCNYYLPFLNGYLPMAYHHQPKLNSNPPKLNHHLTKSNLRYTLIRLGLSQSLMQAFLLLVTNDYFGLIVIEFGQCTTECGQLLMNLARFIAKFG